MVSDLSRPQYLHAFRIKPPSGQNRSTSGLPSTADSVASRAEGTLKRKSNGRSQRGCLACRSSRKKCDEARPTCFRCEKRRETCVYREDEGQFDQRLAPSCSIIPCVAALIANHLSNAETTTLKLRATPEFASFSVNNVQTLAFFSDFTCFTLGTPNVQTTYRSEIVRLAISRPYLMHAVLALGQCHQRYLLQQTSSPDPQETQRYSAALVSYNGRLSEPVTSGDADALLATATLVNAYAFATLPTTDPWQSWPLVDTSSDLQWLSVQPGPGLIIANTMQWIKDSVLLSAIADFSPQSDAIAANSNATDPATLLSILEGVYEPDLGGSVERNVYSPYVDQIAALLPLNACTANMGQYLPFIASLQPDFMGLLRGKDPRALLILAWWYALVCPLEQWWLAGRVRTECAAICIYLMQNCTPAIARLIEFPASRCGYDVIAEISSRRGATL